MPHSPSNMFRYFLWVLFFWSSLSWAIPPTISARAFLVWDVSSQQILAEQASDQRVEPASLTKLMTAYLVFDALANQRLSLQDEFSISTRAWKMLGSRMFIDPKMKVSVDDLLKGMIVQSGNDASVALAEIVAGSVEGFVDLMNIQAQKLGMKSTSYKNPEGLTQTGHYTTAQDLAILVNHLITTFPQYLPYYAIKNYHYPGTPLANDRNRNLLLFRDPTVDGLKTGYTENAGYCMIATASKPITTGLARRLVAIVLGAQSEESRAQEAQKLLNWGFTAFDLIALTESGKSLEQVEVWKGQIDTLKLGATKAHYLAVAKGEKVSMRAEYYKPLIAPFTSGQVVGKMLVSVDQKLTRELPLVALDEIPLANWFKRNWHTIRLWWSS
ncbi:MAG: D-alanyl-D-alanine carboxypeptidase family protein [Gammaproteobacteria bacterium]|nr:D-alanyl-D-alanine carboxypeptidase family protein [Gammaproteobacteria bacterium]